MNLGKSAFHVLSISLKIVVAALIVLGIVRLGSMAFEYGHDVYNQTAMEARPGRDITVTIPEGASNREIGKLLEEKGLIKDSTLFVIQAALSRYGDEMQAGTYTLNTSWIPDEIIEALAGQTPETEKEE